MRWSDIDAIAVVGATGAVGRELLSILSERGVRPAQLRLLASDRSHGASIDYAGRPLTITSVDRASLAGADVVFFLADAETSRRHAPGAAAAGALVVDNSSAFRLDSATPLIIPEINSIAVNEPGPTGALIASPNCSTTIMLLAIEPLRRAFGVEAIDVTTYQAVSGAGLAAIRELEEQCRADLERSPRPHRFFHEPCAFNVFSHESDVETETGVNGEERKIIEESRKILESTSLRITPTCIRVPTRRAHTQAIAVELREPATAEDVHERYQSAQGVQLVDDRRGNRFPTPLNASGQDDVLVGRLRPDPAESSDPARPARRWLLMASGDQLRKGAALNAAQIVEARLGIMSAFVPA